MSTPLPRHQRGAAALGVTLMLLFVLAMVVGMAHRNLLFEQRSSANQLRSTRAFEAAEAGLEWAQALLNRGGAIGADCALASAVPGDKPFRERFLAWDAASGQFAPRTWAAPGGPTALQAACVATDEGWACSCPTDAVPDPAASEGSAVRPAFVVGFVAAPRAGMVEVAVTGCDHFGPACQGASAGEAGATLHATLALLPALASVPSAALTARGAIESDATLTLANQDEASAGFTARAGGAIALPAADLVTLPGRSGPDSLAALDPALAALDAEGLLTRLLGVDRARWLQLPGVRSVDCSADCAAALAAATAPAQGASSMLWVTGDLALEGPAAIGSAEKPLLIVVEGQLRLQGDVTIHGAIVTLAATWDTSGTTGAQVHGALVALGDVRGDGTPTLVRDPAVLARLHGEIGHFTRVAGSWRDF